MVGAQKNSQLVDKVNISYFISPIHSPTGADQTGASKEPLDATGLASTRRLQVGRVGVLLVAKWFHQQIDGHFCDIYIYRYTHTHKFLVIYIHNLAATETVNRSWLPLRPARPLC